MTIRKTARILFIVFGLFELGLFTASGFESTPDLIGGGMLLFIGATNFCTQCPLLSAVTEMFKRRRYKKISTDKI